MSSYTNHIKDDDEFYRGVLEYEHQPIKWVDDPTGALDYYNRVKKITVPDGPVETVTDMIGPYNTIAPIKSYITRHRSRKSNLRLVRIEKVTGWEEVEI